MEIGPITIITPYENPAQFEPAWRHHVALGLRDNPEILIPDKLRNDEYIAMQLNHLQHTQLKNEAFFDTSRTVARQAFDIYNMANNSSMRYYIEPLLLTEVPFSAIAEDLALSQDVVQYYERVYWACRGEYGECSKSDMLRTTFALGPDMTMATTATQDTVWRMIGATMGYTALTLQWRWQTPAGALDGPEQLFERITKDNLGRLFELSLKGKLQPLDITNYLGQHINYERMRFDTQKGNTKNEFAEILCGVFKLLAPQMNELAQTGEALRLYEEGAVNILNAENAIIGTVVDDKGVISSRMSVDDSLQKALAPLAKQHQSQEKVDDRP